MTPWVKASIVDEDIQLYQEIRYIFEKLPDIDLGVSCEGEKIVLSCHMLVKALVNCFAQLGLSYEVGRFLVVFEHSWLVTKNGNIIDVYPVGAIGGPILYLGDRDGPASKLFLSPDVYLYEYLQGLTEKEFADCVQKIEKEIKSIEYVKFSAS